MMRRAFLLSLVAAGVLCTSTVTLAQTPFPSQAIKLVVPYSPGGGTDYFARNVAQEMGVLLGQAVVVENRPGASGLIAGQYVAKQAPADGHTILWGDMTTYAVNPTLMEKMQKYNIQQDLAAVTMAGKLDLMLVVNPQVLPVASVQELLQLLSTSPDGVNYANPSIGTAHHLASELFTAESGAKLVGINYKGGGPAVQDLLGGQVGMMFLDRATAKQFIDAGKLRAIAVAGTQRLPQYPDIPTVSESGIPGFNVEAWQGLSVRAGTPQQTIDVLSNAFSKALETPGLREKLADSGIDAIASTPEKFNQLIEQETVRWEKLIRTNGIKAE